MSMPRPLISLNAEDLECLQPEGLVTGVVINAFLRLIERRSVYYPSLPKVYAIDTTFLVDWERGGIEATRNRATWSEISGADLILFPLHLPKVRPNGHWALAVVEMKSRIIQAYDPLGFPRLPEVLQILDYLRCLARSEEQPFSVEGWRTAETPDGCPRQPDAVSCGVFVCVYADKAARGATIAGNRIGPNEARLQITMKLIKGKFDHENFDRAPQVKQRRLPSLSSGVVLDTVDLTSPVGQGDKDEVENHLLIEELDAAIGAEPEAMVVDGCPAKAETTPPGGAGPSSPCLFLETSDLEEERELKTPTPAPASNQPLLSPPAAVTSRHRDRPRRNVGGATRESTGANPVYFRVTVHNPTSGSEGRSSNRNRTVERCPPPVRPRYRRSPHRRSPHRYSSRHQPSHHQPSFRQPSSRQPPSRQDYGATRVRRTYRPRETRDLSLRVNVSLPRRTVTAYRPRSQATRLPGDVTIPVTVARRVARSFRNLTPAQRRNKRWRIFRQDGTFIRFRPHQVHRLLRQ